VTSEQAIELARRFAIDSGVDAAKYDARAAREGTLWTVDFLPKETKPRPGDFFSVHFDERTPSSMRLVPGK
jgi:hypothetical protein